MHEMIAHASRQPCWLSGLETCARATRALACRCKRVLARTRPDSFAGCLASRLALLALVCQGALDSRCARVQTALRCVFCDFALFLKDTNDQRGFV